MRHFHHISESTNESEILQYNQNIPEKTKQDIIDQLKTKFSELEDELVKVIVKSIRQEEIMVSLRKELQELNNLVKDDHAKKRVKKNLSLLEETLVGHSSWKDFEMMVNDLQSNFTVALKEKYNDLTSRDLKVCVYLRMNMSTKEIADVLGISHRSAEDIRYRLRKKFGLQKSDSLTGFILSFSA